MGSYFSGTRAHGGNSAVGSPGTWRDVLVGERLGFFAGGIDLGLLLVISI